MREKLIIKFPEKKAKMFPPADPSAKNQLIHYKNLKQ